MPNQNTLHDDLVKRCEPLFSAVIADALDALGYRHQSPRIQLLPLTGVPKLVGRCKTTLWADIAHEDPHTYDLELKAVDSCRVGDVLIAAANGSMRSGIWGELLSTAARNAECVGAIVDGAVRDVQQMTQMGFRVFARGTCVYDSLNRQKVIEFDVPVEIEGVCFNPGDLVLADVDGVVVVPQEVEQQVIGMALEKVNSENEVRQAIQGGMKAMVAWEKYGVL
ncbi:MAG: RraA family protein [Verrucomicrobiales bacterium]|nr:RraA family protein [Verrucomicrobiales bacterium]